MLDDLADRLGEWLSGIGPESDIVMSSRIRLARNLADFPFVRRCTDIDRANIELNVREQLKQHERLREFQFINVAELNEIDRQFLVERQLISRELAEGEGARTVAVDPQERVSIMINEEDHLRVQAFKSGFDLQGVWRQIEEIDDLIESHLNYAFHESLGYLTACPTNIGTGMRVSVLVHMPALVITKQIDKVFRSLQRINLVVRGLYGEGSQAFGDFYQVSNQITLGKTEEDLVTRVSEVVPVLINYERKAREYLVDETRHDLFDEVCRSHGTLKNAQKITSEETMHHLSRVRLGVHLGLINDLEITTINRLLLNTQPAHLQKILQMIMPTNQRNIERANYLQTHLRPKSDSAHSN